MQSLVESPEDNLEVLYALARRYPLLTQEDEHRWDDRKWTAVEELLGTLCGDDDSRTWLLALIRVLLDEPGIQVDQFSSREHFFVTQREIKELGKLPRRLDQRTLFKLFNEDCLPATLVVGCAEYVLGAEEHGTLSPVAAALADWIERNHAALKAPATEERTLKALRHAVASYLFARDKLTLHNLRLVFTIAGRYKGKGVAHNDLVQEGIIGLLRAAEKYRYKTGNRFSTYAFNWISQAVRRHSVEQGGIIRYPTHVQEQVSRLYRLRSDLWAKGEQTRPSDLARVSGLSETKVRDILSLRNLPSSLDTPLYDDDGNTTLGDTLSGGPFDDQEESAWRVSLNKQLKCQLDKLEPAEAEVVAGRWGLDGGPPLTRAQLADRMRISREWVRQLEQSALTKLQSDPSIVETYNHYKLERNGNEP
ncbi:MAG: RNA polymerase sigma factor RpoD/SigA [Pseudomonadota bacterium]